MKRAIDKLLKGLSLREIEEIVLGSAVREKIPGGSSLYFKNMDRFKLNKKKMFDEKIFYIMS